MPTSNLVRRPRDQQLCRWHPSRVWLERTRIATFRQPDEGISEAMAHDRGFRPGYASALVAAAAVLSCRLEDSQASALAFTQQEFITEKAGSWVKVQADLTSNQTVKIGFPFNPSVTGPDGSGPFNGSRGTVGVTLLPERTVPSPNSKPAGLCTSVGGAASGYSSLSSQQYPVTQHQFVARAWLPGGPNGEGRFSLGVAQGDNCATCNNTCPGRCEASLESPVAPTSLGQFLYNPAGYADFPGPANNVTNVKQEQANFFLQDAAGLINRTDLDSSVNTAFEILVEPEPGADFSYTWKPLSDIMKDGALDLLPHQSLFQINGSTPCCIPISERMYAEINSTRDSFAKEAPPKTWLLTSSPISGQLMGVCNGIPEQDGASAPSAIFSYYSQIYSATEAEIMDPATSPVALLIQSHGDKDVAATLADGKAPQADPGTVLKVFQQVKRGSAPLSNPAFVSSGSGMAWELVNETVTDFPASPEAPPGGCKMSQDVVSPSGYIDQYVPADRRTHVAIIQTNKLIGRQQGTTQWTLGRASRLHDAKTGRSTTLFLGSSTQGFERNASLLSSPPEFYVLTNANSGPPGRAKFEYKWAKRDAIGKTIPRSSYVFSVNGLSPCCVNIPGNGSIMGTCNINLNQSLAFYTWDRLQHATSISNADLLYIVPVGKSYAGAIAGGVIGGVLLVGILGYLLGVGLWSMRSYGFRARKRLIEDQVYSIVIGAQSSDVYGLSSSASHADGQAGVNIDRFYNLLPFHSHMPRNQFFAELASKVARMCLASWTSKLGTGPRTTTSGVFDARFEGKEPEALAFAIMKHDTVWGSSSKAIVQLLRRGRKGHKQLGQMVEGVLISPEIDDFLDGLDTRPVQMHRIFHEGVWRAMARLFCLALPSQHTRVDDAIADCEEAAPLSKAGCDSAQTPNFMLRGTDESTESLTAEKQAQRHAAAMAQVIADLQLDDWAVKEKEIEIMRNADGSLCELGHGAFGQVFKAKWNEVQIVAVKQLRAISDDKAQLNFLREVAVLKRVRAENIVRFLGICISTDKTMLLTELMEGGDLWTALNNPAQREELSWYRKGERIAGDMARGVAFLHSQQIVHFDIKSPNILLARDHTAKLADVGLARFMHKQHFTAITNVGTLQWAAPEILAGKVEKITMKCDVYSFGVVLWELVTSESPRFGQAWYRAPRVPDECPQWVADLITECMRSNPDKRPTSKEVFETLRSGGSKRGKLRAIGMKPQRSADLPRHRHQASAPHQTPFLSPAVELSHLQGSQSGGVSGVPLQRPLTSMQIQRPSDSSPALLTRPVFSMQVDRGTRKLPTRLTPMRSSGAGDASSVPQDHKVVGKRHDHADAQRGPIIRAEGSRQGLLTGDSGSLGPALKLDSDSPHLQHAVDMMHENPFASAAAKD